MGQSIAVVGGGGFGRGLARAAARVGRHVVLWSRTPRTLDDPKIRCTMDMAELAEAELLFVAVPSVHIEACASRLGTYLDGSHLLVHVSRGLIGDELGTVGEVLRRRTPCRRIGALAGPLVAQSLATGEPGGGVVGSLFPEVAEAVRAAISGPRLRVYQTEDVVGVEMASALVGLVALTVGYAQGIGLGAGTLAVLATRGMVESARVGVLRGASQTTFSGLAGFGDLLAAVAGDDRPEILFGRALAKNLAIDDAAAQAGAYVEGASIARRVAAFADRHGTEAPLAAMTAAVLEGSVSGKEAIARLMSRPTRTE